MRSKTGIIILKISFIALFSALIFVCGAFLAIPYAGGAGYFNFSDILILFFRSRNWFNSWNYWSIYE